MSARVAGRVTAVLVQVTGPVLLVDIPLKDYRALVGWHSDPASADVPVRIDTDRGPRTFYPCDLRAVALAGWPS